MARRSNTREFIAWDGEGIAYEALLDFDIPGIAWNGNQFVPNEPHPQPYVLLANSKEERITNRQGLSTKECFDFILDTKQRYPHSIFVGFAFNYDVNQILKDVPEEYLWGLHATNEAAIGSYYVKWLPRKWFEVRHSASGRSARIYDVFSFFQKSFLQVCKEYLGNTDPELGIIQSGKESRQEFHWEELDDFIIPYNDTELSMLVRIMNILRRDFEHVDIKPKTWHGPGSVANQVFRKEWIPISREIPEEVLDAAQFAYAGGRFEQFGMGRHANTVYEYDIRSAYPEATTYLPNLCNGTWEYVERFEPGSFGVWHINYVSDHGFTDEEDRPQPLFCRSNGGNISYPTEVEGWYWTPEAELVPSFVEYGWIFREHSTDRPFAFVQGMYEQRRLLKEQKNSTERALKLILNSLYGKLAQTIGGKDGPPQWHQLEYAGFITSYTRAKIFRAIQQNPDAIIATETDAVFSQIPLDLEIGTGLGQWEVSEFSEIVYLQSGFYYAVQEDGTIISKYRGMDRDRQTMQPKGLPYELVAEFLDDAQGFQENRTTCLMAHTTRFVGMGLGLRTNAVWRSWENKAKFIMLDHDPFTNSKRVHSRDECPSCCAGVSLFERLHPMRIGGYRGKSYARALPWREIGGQMDTEMSEEELREMNPDVRDFAEDMDKWQ